MRPLIFIFSLLIIFYNSRVFSKTWFDQPAVPDLSHMSEYDKASYWLNERREVNFEIYPNSPFDLKPLMNVISIIHIEDGIVKACATREGFEEFIEYNIPYAVTTPELLTGHVPMSDYSEYLAGTAPADWYHYPTYPAYVDFLDKWQQDFPQICKKYNLGPSGVANKNHHIYALRISDNVAVNEAEPRYLETNVIHGDEPLNMMNCLHMIDTILNSYGKDSRITALVDSLEMWFVPNMNPDGTYKGGDNTVQGAIRYNLADGFDLNRNFPSPNMAADGTMKYGKYTYYAKESQALMDLHNIYKFQFSQDQHGGTETYLWPYGGTPERPKDEDWYKWLTKRLVKEIHDACNNNGYMTSCGGDGVGNVYHELYPCTGIRCDMNDWAGNGKALTLESSKNKMLPESDLERHWGYCKEALFMSMEILYQYGLHGIVVDSLTNEPIFKVEITRSGDIPNGTSLTDSCGRYVKYMNKGRYTLTFSHDDYHPREFPNYEIATYDKRYNLHVKMWPKVININNSFEFIKNKIYVKPYSKGIKIDNSLKYSTVGIYNVNGRLIKMLPVSRGSNIVWDGRDRNGKFVSNGCYILKISKKNESIAKSFLLNR